MADTNIDAKEYWLFIDPAGGTDYSNVVCGTDFNLSLSNSTNNRQTFCGPKSTPGDQTVTIPYNGEIIKDPTTGELSAPDIFTLAQNQTTFSWKSGKLNPGAGDITKTGRGYFSSYQETFNSTDVAKFSCTITVDGLVDQVIETGS
jgi:hypothetical protein